MSTQVEPNVSRMSAVGAEFLALVYADEELVRAEFEEIVEQCLDGPHPPRPLRPADPAPRQRRRRLSRAWHARVSRPRERGSRRSARQRGPPRSDHQQAR